MCGEESVVGEISIIIGIDRELNICISPSRYLQQMRGLCWISISTTLPRYTLVEPLGHIFNHEYQDTSPAKFQLIIFIVCLVHDVSFMISLEIQT